MSGTPERETLLPARRLKSEELFPLLVCENGHGWRTVFPASFSGRPCSVCATPLIEKCRVCRGDLVRTKAGRLICGGECANV